MGERTKAIERDARIGLDTGMPARVKEIKEWLAINRGQWEEGLTHSFERLFQMGKEKEVSYLQVCFTVRCRRLYRKAARDIYTPLS